MKLSFKFQDDLFQRDHDRQIVTAKLPMTIFNVPLSSGVTATTAQSASDFAFSFSTNFSFGPSFKISYALTSSSSAIAPFSLSVKSGVGMFGSPHDSPVVFSANFSLSPANILVPAFFIHFKPQFGNFYLEKVFRSNPRPDQISGSPHNGSLNNGEIGNGFDSETSMAPKNNSRYNLSPEVAVMARTVMPVTNRLSLNLRWCMNFRRNMGLKTPYLTLNKIEFERVGEAKKNKQCMENFSDSGLQLLKSMRIWMSSNLENVEKERGKIKLILDEMKMEALTSNRDNGNGKKKVLQHSGESSGEFWRSKKNRQTELKLSMLAKYQASEQCEI